VKFFNPRGRQTKQSAADYYPKSIGLPLPGNMFDYEFLVCARNTPYTQNQIMSVFIDHGAMLLALDSSTDSTENKFILSICCNLEHADLGPVELAVQLQSMKFVISAQYYEIRGRLFGRRGLSLNSRHEAVALRSSTLIHLGQRLAKESGSIGTAALYQEGREYAHSIISELGEILNHDAAPVHTFYYGDQKDDATDESNNKPVEAFCMKCRMMRRMDNPKQVLFSNKTHAVQGQCAFCSTKVFKIGSRIYGKILVDPLIENVQAFLMATGWGMFELRSAIEGRFGEVTISEPPTVEGDISFGNQFVEGIAAGLLEAASGCRNKMELVGEKFDRDTRILALNFAERIPIKVKRSRKSDSSTKKESTNILPPVASGRAVVEVDRIIDSLEKIETDGRASLGENEKEIEVGGAGQLISKPISAHEDS